MSVSVLSAHAPMAGVLTPLAELDDPVFAQEIVGSGVALAPTTTGVVTVCAPLSGRLVTIHPHAFVLSTAQGISLLVHLGIDTVTLQGAGFDVLVEEKSEVASGQPLVSWDLEVARAAGMDLRVPVIVLEDAGTTWRLCAPWGEELAQAAPLLEFSA